MEQQEQVELGSFAQGMNAVVVGATGGIGRAFVEWLAASPQVASVWALSRSADLPTADKVEQVEIDVLDEEQLARVAADAKERLGRVDLVLVAIGVLHDGDDLHPEKTWRHVRAEALRRVYEINAIAPALVGKHFLPLLRRDHKSAFAALSARVGSIEDNGYGGWHSYRASKAALNMLLRNFAIELARGNKQALCVGLHPGTVDTGLSEPFQGNVPEGKLFTPAYATMRMLETLNALQSSDSGGLFAYDKERIAF